MDSDETRAIVDALNKPPFTKEFTLIGFDAQAPLQLLQVLNDVIEHINGNDRPTQIRQEEPEETLSRMLSALRVFRYKPAGDVKAFRASLIGGEKATIYPILQWLLERLEDLKLRAYLGKFLVRLEVPADFLQDQEVAEMNEKYGGLIKEFTEVHQEVEQHRKSGFSAKDIKEDMLAMDQEKEQIVKRIDRIKRKCERFPQYEEMLQASRLLRKEHDREDELRDAAVEQQKHADAAEARYTKARDRLREAESTTISGADELMARTDEEHSMLKYMAREKLVAAVAERQAHVDKLERVLAQPMMTREDVDALHHRIDELTAETNRLMEKRMVSNDSGADRQMALYKQQASIIARKKEDAADRLMERQERLQALEAQLAERRKGDSLITRDEFMRYAEKLRPIAKDYKAKKSDLGNARSEVMTLEGTVNVLEAKAAAMDEALKKLEAEKGVSGYHETQQTLEAVSMAANTANTRKEENLQDMAAMAAELNASIDKRRHELAPLVKKLRAARVEKGSLEGNYNEKKSAYERTAKDLETSRSALEKEVRMYREEVGAYESRYHHLNALYDGVQAQSERVAEEKKAYRTQKPSFRDACQERIDEAERLGKHLREKQGQIETNHESNLRQCQLWHDLRELMQVKLTSAPENKRAEAGGPHGEDGEDNRLVL
mmetsp:Transcript_36598/g.95838  ORF Transcript_36598/g.95838 Transcript_36598/m.95838 type:complete len:665 (+) Transcript_36598:322-2316(+)